jgi:hypothetical protein
MKRKANTIRRRKARIKGAKRKKKIEKINDNKKCIAKFEAKQTLQSPVSPHDRQHKQ